MDDGSFPADRPAGCVMFVEIITDTAANQRLIEQESGLLDDPPDDLLALVSWRDGDNVSTLMAWRTPGARGDFAAEHVMPLFERGLLAATGETRRLDVRDLRLHTVHPGP